MKILIVDDSTDDRLLLRACLEHYGCEVIEAGDGREACAQAAAVRPDIIISDAMMPAMDGFQFLREVKKNEALKAIPFIFYSATYGEQQDVSFALSLGAEEFITKPKEPEEFWAALSAVLERLKQKGWQTPAPERERIETEEDYLAAYSRIVAGKLGEKVRELEAAKAEIERKNADWEALFNSFGDAITIHDRDFNIIKANKAAADLLGLPPEEVRTRKCHELFHGKNEPLEGCYLAKTVASGARSDAEFYEPHLNRWLALSCFLLPDADGSIRAVIHYARDITAAKNTAATMQTILESVGEGFVVIDRDYRILTANRAYCEQTKRSPGDVVGKYCYEVSHGINKPCYLAGKDCPAYQTYKTGAPHSAVHIHQDKNGNPVYIETRSFPMKDACGNPHAVVEILNNITEKRALEGQLRHAQKMESIGTLAGGIAHDFNNLLNVIMGYGSLMEMQMKPGDPLLPQLEEMLAAGDRASQLTKGLLAFSRKQVMEIKTASINEIIEGFRKMLGRIIGEDISLKIGLSEQPLMIQVDIVQIEQVLLNLAINARDAMRQGGLLIIEAGLFLMDASFIGMHGFGKPGKYALLTVSDTGSGMDETTRERIFEPFFTTKKQERGTGLGLAIVYGIVKQHKGYINCYSEPGKGTTFRIYLPLVEAEVAAVGKATVVPQGGTETILLAEDDAGVRRLTREILEGFGYSVIEAEDGRDAVEKFNTGRDRIRLLLFDFLMPGKNGAEAYHDIQATGSTVQVIFLSGYSRDIMQKFGMQDDAEFISKPVLPVELLRKVREMLDRSAAISSMQ